MDTLATIDSKRLVIYLFVLVMVVSFVKLAVVPVRVGVFEKKVFGALTIFTVALIANNSWVYSISFFIGGLIIATENFLIHLAGIFKSDKQHVSDITRDYYAKISPAEAEERLEKEAVEIVRNDEKAKATVGKVPSNNLEQKIGAAVSSIKYVEREVLKALAEYVDGSLKPLVIQEQARVAGEDYVKTFDAIVTHVGSKSIYAGVEIKYFPKFRIDNIKTYFRHQANAYNAYKTLFVLVLEKLSAKEKQQLLKFRLDILKNNDGIGIVLAELKERRIVIFEDSDLEAFFPSAGRAEYNKIINRYRAAQSYMEALHKIRGKK